MERNWRNGFHPAPSMPSQLLCISPQVRRGLGARATAGCSSRLYRRGWVPYFTVSQWLGDRLLRCCNWVLQFTVSLWLGDRLLRCSGWVTQFHSVAVVGCSSSRCHCGWVIVYCDAVVGCSNSLCGCGWVRLFIVSLCPSGCSCLLCHCVPVCVPVYCVTVSQWVFLFIVSL